MTAILMQKYLFRCFYTTLSQFFYILFVFFNANCHTHKKSNEFTLVSHFYHMHFHYSDYLSHGQPRISRNKIVYNSYCTIYNWRNTEDLFHTTQKITGINISAENVHCKLYIINYTLSRLSPLS